MNTARAPRSRRARAVAPVAAAVVLVALGATAPPLLACGYHDASSVGPGMLNWAYPDALHVRTAVWTAQREGTLAPPGGGEPLQPGSPAYVLRQMQQFRQIEAQLRAWRERLAARESGEQAAFSVVFIGSMLWTRFETVDGALTMVVHADGPRPGDVVLVTDAPVVAAMAEGRLAPGAARQAGLLRSYGEPASVERVAAFLDGFEVSRMDLTSKVEAGNEREGTAR